jgi:hypothetical protein
LNTSGKIEKALTEVGTVDTPVGEVSKVCFAVGSTTLNRVELGVGFHGEFVWLVFVRRRTAHNLGGFNCKKAVEKDERNRDEAPERSRRSHSEVEGQEREGG